MSNEQALSESECFETLDLLFPKGPAGEDVLRELAKDGWEQSPLHYVFHPSVEQLLDEAIAMHESLLSLRRPDDERAIPPRPSMDEIRARYAPTPIVAGKECTELVGLCVWDIFSENNEVRSRDGRWVDLGSFRGSAGTIAEWIGRHSQDRQYDYLDFYMGTIWVGRRADLCPVYRAIFRRLKQHGFDWTFYFPRLHLIDMKPLHERTDDPQSSEFPGYDPSAGFAEQQRQSEVERMREEMDDAYREDVENAAGQPAPPRVQAYRKIYGRFPNGWPPVAE